MDGKLDSSFKNNTSGRVLSSKLGEITNSAVKNSFYPKTGRSPSGRGPEVKANIGDYLYSQARNLQEKINRAKKDEELKFAEMRRQVHKGASANKSDKIVEETKK